MHTVLKAVIAGFGATIVLSALMLAKSAMGMLPSMNVIFMLAHMAHHMLGMPALPVTGWLLHFFIGTVLWGVSYGLLINVLPGKSPITKGMVFSIAAWILMMVVVMPLAGKGLFATQIGIMAPVATLVLHLIWGAALGLVFQLLPDARVAA